jgi:hypothetical protein
MLQAVNATTFTPVADSFPFDARGFDNRPPFLDLSLLESGVYSWSSPASARVLRA